MSEELGAQILKLLEGVASRVDEMDARLRPMERRWWWVTGFGAGLSFLAHYVAAKYGINLGIPWNR